MEILISRNNQKKTNSLNSFGVIADNELKIYQHCNIISIKINQISKVSFHKKRNYILNNISFCLSIGCAFAFLNTQMSINELLFLGGIFIGAVICGFKINWMEFTFLIVTTNLDYTELKIEKHLKEDAEEILTLINKKLKSES
jgi:hypothetical protein